MTQLTDYQQAVKAHMEGAPEELAEYVRGRLRESKGWEEGENPVTACGFLWKSSQEGEKFWDEMSYKRWEEAMNTNFWKEHTAQVERLSEGGYAEAIKAEYERLATKQVAKNSDYGDSAFEDIYLMGNTITAKQACIARMSDKIKRLQSTNLKVDESFFDTLDDLIGYIVVYNILNKR